VFGALALLAAVSGGCGGEADVAGPDAGFDPGGPVVGDFVSSACGTDVVLGLSLQIADEIGCMSPAALVPFAETDVRLFAGGAVLPYISEAGLADLDAALAANPGLEMRINSGFRTVAQQYLLYQWSLLGRCNIAIAAEPGRSNHESGRALDIGNFGDWSSRLPPFNWEQTVPGDAVHFDHVTSDDNRGLDVLAFQRLWNRNAPGDRIDEDGLYGPQTEARLEQAPADGFASGASCAALLSDRAEIPTGLPAPISCAH
jgi:hypothetical protein